MLSEVPNAGTVFSNQFEEGDFTAWTGTNGNPSVVTTWAHHGTNCVLLDNDYEKVYKTITGASPCWFRFYFQFSIAPATSETYLIAHLGRGDEDYAGCYIRNNAGSIEWGLEVYKSDWSKTLYWASSPNPTINTVYCVEIGWIKNTLGGAYLYIDGVSVLNPAVTTLDHTITDVYLKMLTSGSSSPNQRYDCVVVSSAYIGVENRPPLVNDSSDNTAVQVVAYAAQTVAATALKSMYNLDACGL